MKFSAILFITGIWLVSAERQTSPALRGGNRMLGMEPTKPTSLSLKGAYKAGGTHPLSEESRYSDHPGRKLNLWTDRRWKERVGGVVQVPYKIKSSDFSSDEIRMIEDVVDHLNSRIKVLKFVPRTNQAAYIQIIQESGSCWADAGKASSGKVQYMNLGHWCVREPGTIQHEFLHSLGMFHEQSRPDRDDYVTINLSNVPEKDQHNFDKHLFTTVLGSPYEYGSVMHYSRTAFAINDNIDTLTPKQAGASIGQRDGATDTDIKKIRLMYQCPSGPRSWSSYHSNTCTSECPCWEGATGCSGNNSACMGDLTTCSNNKCVTAGGGGGGGGGGASYVEIYNAEDPDYCIDVSYANTDNTNRIIHYPCNGTPAQQFWHDDNNYLRSALDDTKCIVGSAGDTSQGTNLIIHDCFENDTRFVWDYYTDDSIRPRNNNEQCVGPSRSETHSSLNAPLIHLWDCSNSPHQQWKGRTPSQRRELRTKELIQDDSPSRLVDEESTCSDLPNGWYDIHGDNCAWYAEGTNCKDYGSEHKNFGKTANQACCACGGGSTANHPVADTTLHLSLAKDILPNSRVVPEGAACYDFENWFDSVGDNCVWYAQGDHCDVYGSQFASEAGSAQEACCACGGGTSSPPRMKQAKMTEEKPGCSDSPSHWHDADGDDCSFYALEDNCARFGSDSIGTWGKTTNEACCACGGGLHPLSSSNKKETQIDTSKKNNNDRHLEAITNEETPKAQSESTSLGTADEHEAD